LWENHDKKKTAAKLDDTTGVRAASPRSPDRDDQQRLDRRVPDPQFEDTAASETEQVGFDHTGREIDQLGTHERPSRADAANVRDRPHAGNRGRELEEAVDISSDSELGDPDGG